MYVLIRQSAPPDAYRGVQSHNPLTKSDSCFILGASFNSIHGWGALMFISLDWLSFTFDMQLDQEVLAFELWGRAAGALAKQLPLAYQMLVQGREFVPKMGRAPYNASQHRDDHGVVLFAHQRLPHSLVEVSGIGCDALGSIEAELALLQEVAPRLTRLDIAVDIFTETRPDEFARHREEGHFKSWSEAVSDSGHTVYIGSKTSDRYARVYRYNHPHPRHQFLRVEHVLKAEQAKAAAQQIQSVGLETFVALIGNTFGWQHADWSPADDTAEAAEAWRPERRSGKTVAWLYSQVMPAIAKLHREGVVTSHDLVEALAAVGVDINRQP